MMKYYITLYRARLFLHGFRVWCNRWPSWTTLGEAMPCLPRCLQLTPSSRPQTDRAGARWAGGGSGAGASPCPSVRHRWRSALVLWALRPVPYRVCFCCRGHLPWTSPRVRPGLTIFISACQYNQFCELQQMWISLQGDSFFCQFCKQVQMKFTLCVSAVYSHFCMNSSFSAALTALKFILLILKS